MKRMIFLIVFVLLIAPTVMAETNTTESTVAPAADVSTPAAVSDTAAAPAAEEAAPAEPTTVKEDTAPVADTSAATDVAVKLPDVNKVITTAEEEGAGLGTYGALIVLLLAAGTIIFRLFQKKKTP